MLMLIYRYCFSLILFSYFKLLSNSDGVLQLQFLIFISFISNSFQRPNIFTFMIINKRQAFSRQIRSKQRNSILNQMRMNMIKMETIHNLNHLIEIATNSDTLTFQQFMLLTQWGKNGEINAIFFLGNLLIDQILTICLLAQYQNRMRNYFQNEEGWVGTSRQYLWILHILYEKNHFYQKELVQLCSLIAKQVHEYHKFNQIQKINDNRFLAEHGLVLLRKIFKSHSSAIELLLTGQNQQLRNNLIKSIVRICESGLDQQITVNCYSIINIFLTTFQDESKIHQLITQKELSEVILVGSFRKQSYLRCLSYQILTNTLICFSSVQDSILQLCLSSYRKFSQQKRSVRIQISYLLHCFTENIDKFGEKQLSEKIKLVQTIEMMIGRCKQKEQAVNCMESIESVKFRKKNQNISKQQREYLNSVSTSYCLSNILNIWESKFSRN